MKRIVLPLILSLCYIAESKFVEYVSYNTFGDGRIVVPHFLLTVLIIMGIYYIRNRALLYAFIFGLIFDVSYTGILGVYLFLFPLSIYITSKMMKVLQSNIFIAAMVVMLNMAIVEFLVYELNVLIKNTSMPLMDFLNLRLWPTLVVNLVFYIIISYPLKNWLQRKQRELSEE